MKRKRAKIRKRRGLIPTSISVADLGEGPGPYFGKKKKISKNAEGRKAGRASDIRKSIFFQHRSRTFFSACSKKIRIRHFVLFLAHYATLASDSFTVAMLAGKKGGKTAPPPSLAKGLDPPLNIDLLGYRLFVIYLCSLWRFYVFQVDNQSCL